MEQYQAVREERIGDDSCPLCSRAAMREFTHWKLLENRFPYDRIAKVHHMILPKRHVVEGEITEEEWAEYHTLKSTFIATDYDMIMEGTPRQKSIPAHFHLHLIELKEE